MKALFRADLLDRLAFDVVQLPPLRERESDIMLMAEHFAIQMCREIKAASVPGVYGARQRNIAELSLAGKYS
ncbi:hypothetical protein ACP0HM_04055 [Escherichia coli]